MHLTTLLNGSDHADFTRKGRLTEDKCKRHENKKGLQTDMSFVLRKNGGHRPSSLGSRLIVVVSE